MSAGHLHDLLEQLESKSDAKRREAAQLLGDLGDVEAIQSLIRLMMTLDDTVFADQSKFEDPRVTAFKALKKLVTADNLIMHLVDRKYPDVRAGAAHLLGLCTDGSEKVITALKNALNDPDMRVKYESMRSLGYFKQITFEEVSPFLQLPSPTICFQAIHALASIESQQAEEALYLTASNGDNPVPNRALAIRYLGERQAKTAANALTLLLLDKSPTIREHVAIALGRIGAPSTTKALFQTLIDDNEQVRYAAGVALGLMKDPRAVPFLLKAKHHGDQLIQKVVEEGFARLSNEALGELVIAMQQQPAPYRVDAVERIRALKDERSMLVLIPYLLDEEVYPSIRHTLLDLGTAIVSPLTYVLDSEQATSGLKEKAIRLLLDLNSPETIPALLNILNHENAALRELSVRGLGKLKAAQAEDALIKLVQKKDRESDDVIAEALLALGNLQSKKAMPFLLSHLDHLNSKVRGYSISGLGSTLSPEAVLPLIQKLKDPMQDNAPLIIQALAKLGDDRAIPVLLDVVEDARRNALGGAKGSYLGGYAVQALSKLGEPKVIRLLLTDWEEELEGGILQMGVKAIPYLEQIISQERDDQVRALAIEGLGMVAGMSSLGLLIAQLQHSNEKVGKAAARALQKIHTRASVVPLIEDKAPETPQEEPSKVDPPKDVSNNKNASKKNAKSQKDSD